MSDDQPQDPWLGEERRPDPSKATPRAQKGGNEAHWERDVLERLAFASLKEQRRSRRWGLFFKLAVLAYLFIVLFAYWPSTDTSFRGRHTALVEIRGVIAGDREANADHIISGLREAFKNKHAAGIILRINSPGGSPVQAGYVNDEIERLRGLYPNKKVYAVVTDMCASGGYYIAAAADEIYADKASIVGSIGVIMNGFGFVDAMEKLGVERRLFTAGENKALLDPFSPLEDDDMRHVRSMLRTIHQQFIDTVKEGRGDRLKDDKELFSGLIWTGEQSLALGLIDGLGSSGYVAREVVGADDIVDYTYRPPVFERFANRIGAAMANTLSGMLDIELR